jgi:hypothetical protein
MKSPETSAEKEKGDIVLTREELQAMKNPEEFLLRHNMVEGQTYTGVFDGMPMSFEITGDRVKMVHENGEFAGSIDRRNGAIRMDPKFESEEQE